MELNDILSIALRSGASDIHMKAGLPPMFRVNGSLYPMKDAQRLAPEEVSRMAFSIMNNFQKERFREANELDLAYGVPGLGRFRVNVFQQRGTIGAVLRVIPLKIQTITELNLPPAIESIAMEHRGLILVTGTTGSGKSTTLAAMLDHINSNRTAHILTIEDPVEFLVRDKRSIINQREIGVDTMGFPAALRSALRQDPDVILVGEMRDLETIEIALTAAETGHLVMSTLHTLDATETISRIVSVFPPHQQKTIRLQLGAVLKAVVSQRLVPRADKMGRAPALEIMRNTARVRELIEDKDRTKEITDAIAKGYTTYGMQTFDQSLMRLYQAGSISYDEALRQATNADDFALRVSGVAGTSDASWEGFEASPGSSAMPSGRPAPQTAQRRAPQPAPGQPAARTNPQGQAQPPARAPARPTQPSPPKPAPAKSTPQAVDDDFKDRTVLSTVKSAREFALELIAKRSFSRRELAKRLERNGYEPSDVKDALELVGTYGYIDETELANAVVREAVRLGRGVRWIEHRLLRREINATVNLTEEQINQTRDRAREHVLRNYGDLDALNPKERGKAYAFLARRGFTPEDIRVLLGVDDLLD